MKNIFKIAIAGLSLAVLSGCAIGPQATGVNESTYLVSDSSSYNQELKNNIEVETKDFMKTSSNPYSAKATANLDNDTAKEAISKTLDSAGLLAKFGGDYTLEATLVDPDLAGVVIGTNRTYKRNIGIHYKLVKNNGQVVYDNTIYSPVKQDMKIISRLWHEQKKMSEQSYQKNFRLLMEDLKNL